MGKVLCLGYQVSRLLLGWLGATLSIIGIILLYYCLENPDILARWLMSLADDQAKIDYKELRRDVVWSCVLYIVLSFVNLMTSLGLIFGINKYCVPSLKYPFIHLIKKQEKVVKYKIATTLPAGSDHPSKTFNV
ncbi:uncharacterized protein LOC126757406 [Bactrocera neohumeralis]|uniref:uncharacterized protein LOC120771394 n=1 Tax=Bactrocera tryoni TaxID=59916 RepID=UPI001A976788|nr:uncharacterized protein LOC120771394 [Bactrocera tryoni]XP_050327261.1 uncharacterized protein LOC126757406 [Bactrocera neohumeralis]